MSFDLTLICYSVLYNRESVSEPGRADCVCGSMSDEGCSGEFSSWSLDGGASDNGVRKDLLQDNTLRFRWIVIDL